MTAPPSRRPRLHPFEAAVLATARRRRLLGPGDRALVALSGGADSTALLAALAALRDAGHLAALHACHVDHQLRPGAEDAAACESLCARLGVPLEQAAVRVAPGENVQAAARRARYAALRAAARRAGATVLATGHHRGDQAETVLHRLLRGAGARGLAGIPPRRRGDPPIVRPLLDRSRAEIAAYLRDRALGWREDPTNATGRYLRNRLRAELLPLLERLAPGAEARLARAADLLRADDRALERLAAGAVPRGVAGAGRPALRALPVAARRRALRRLWRAAGGGGELSALHVAAMLSALRARGPRRVALPGGVELRVEGEAVVVGPPAAGAAPLLPGLRVDGPGRYAVPGGTLEVAWRSAAPPPWPLHIRSRLPGDRFRPERGRGEKKLKAWLIDRKVPRARRAGLLLVTGPDGQVLCLPELGVRGAGAGPLEVRWIPASDGQPPVG